MALRDKWQPSCWIIWEEEKKKTKKKRKIHPKTEYRSDACMIRFFSFDFFRYSRGWKCQLRRVRGNREQHRCEWNRPHRSGSGRAGAEGCVPGTFAFYLFFLSLFLEMMPFHRHGKRAVDTIPSKRNTRSFNNRRPIYRFLVCVRVCVYIYCVLRPANLEWIVSKRPDNADPPLLNLDRSYES